jgi:hypothetical protein
MSQYSAGWPLTFGHSASVFSGLGLQICTSTSCGKFLNYGPRRGLSLETEKKKKKENSLKPSLTILLLALPNPQPLEECDTLP